MGRFLAYGKLASQPLLFGFVVKSLPYSVLHGDSLQWEGEEEKGVSLKGKGRRRKG